MEENELLKSYYYEYVRNSDDFKLFHELSEDDKLQIRNMFGFAIYKAAKAMDNVGLAVINTFFNK